MAFVITNACDGVCDTACVDVCPMSCIHGPFSAGELETKRAHPDGLAGVQLFIDPDACIDCAVCVPECPVDAIFHEDDVPETHLDDIRRNTEFFASPSGQTR